ncbi:MAG TPA: ATP-dependent helicase [Phycisphaerae bacterium]|nr:ATP-dependent helicase [Phycisphaerae bacterium]
MAEFQPTMQQAALLQTDESALVIAGPGTGKTRTAIEKARVSFPRLASAAHRVLFLSFSNAAVFRLAEGAKAELTYAQRQRIAFRTYHAFAADLLRSHGRFVGIPPVFKIMDALEEKLFVIEEGIATSAPEREEFLKHKAIQGLLGFDVLIPLAVRLLETSDRLRQIIGRAYPLIIVDEFQDTSEVQWELLQAVGQSSQVVAFGDPNQIIYAGMHAATKRRLREFQDWKGIEPVGFSERQFRFGSPEILVFGDALLTATKYKEKEDSGVNLLDLEYRTRNRNRLRSALALIWNQLRKTAERDDTVAFLAFSNRLAEEIAVALRNPPPGARVRIPVYARLPRDEAAYDAVLLAMAAARDFALSGSEVACKRAAVALLAMNSTWYSRAATTAKKLRALTKLLAGSRGHDDKLGECMDELTRATNLSDLVPMFLEASAEIDGFTACCRRIAAHGKLRFSTVPSQDVSLPLFDQCREARTPKGLEGYDSGRGKTHVLNYHKAKGREFDHVVMLVDPRAENREISVDELRRLYYVCATRAKSSLVVLYYGNDKGRVLGSVV